MLNESIHLHLKDHFRVSHTNYKKVFYILRSLLQFNYMKTAYLHFKHRALYVYNIV